MTYYDVFNGDADGICALQQLRLQQPREARRISGLKRDIDLLQRVDADAGDEVTVLDVSLDKNRDALRALTPVPRQQSPDGELRVRLNDPEKMAEALEITRGLARPVQTLTGVGANDIEVNGAGDIITITLSDAEKQATDELAKQRKKMIDEREKKH